MLFLCSRVQNEESGFSEGPPEDTSIPRILSVRLQLGNILGSIFFAQLFFSFSNAV